MSHNCLLCPLLWSPQQLAEESTYRNELQMQLDSKESDIEQLRERLNDLQLRMDNSSVTSLQTDETDSNIAGKVFSPSLFPRALGRPIQGCPDIRPCVMVILLQWTKGKKYWGTQDAPFVWKMSSLQLFPNIASTNTLFSFCIGGCC